MAPRNDSKLSVLRQVIARSESDEAIHLQKFLHQYFQPLNKRVLATGVTTSIRDFCKMTFAELGIELEFVGEGVNEKGIDKATGRTLVEVDPRYFRPAEVDLLLGDSTKARKELGWVPKYDLPMLVKEMVQSDLELAQKEKTLKEKGYKVLVAKEG